ncbi:hypothetical protein GWI33_001124 [Rhynchophorus ferrugineus]|uniref:Uncharacterized protein n=1 Tax=Rhynchophorus ferrugineus TaxID=354439 RepID=A0A834ISM8_RHYFE|nr:hypothetical protein GWI33_001124 [Rhynchophorus ferrugineus]
MHHCLTNRSAVARYKETGGGEIRRLLSKQTHVPQFVGCDLLIRTGCRGPSCAAEGQQDQAASESTIYKI